METNAVVIGSGMCGLATAKVLTKHFAKVTVVERDQPQALLAQSALDAARMENKARPGVAQVRPAGS
jgi:glycine/D-amino acid oxidase-like deaminating enzyme